MTFELKIELGNEAMQTGEAVAIVLRQQADYIATRYSLAGIQSANVWHNLMDENGNTVAESLRQKTLVPTLATLCINKAIATMAWEALMEHGK